MDNSYSIVQSFNIAIETARPILEQHPTSGWKKLIDDFANAISNLISGALNNKSHGEVRFDFQFLPTLAH